MPDDKNDKSANDTSEGQFVPWASRQAFEIIEKKLRELEATASIAVEATLEQESTPEHASRLVQVARVLRAVCLAMSDGNNEVMKELESKAKGYLRPRGEPSRDVVRPRHEQLDNIREMMRLWLANIESTGTYDNAHDGLAESFVSMVSNARGGELGPVIAAAGIKPIATVDGPVPVDELERQRIALQGEVARVFSKEIRSVLKTNASEFSTKNTATKLVRLGLAAIGARGDLFSYDRKRDGDE